MASEPKESPANNPGLHATPDEATKGYFMQQTMLRVKDPKVSLDFYSRVLGMSAMTHGCIEMGALAHLMNVCAHLMNISFEDQRMRLLKRLDYPEWKFSLYFMGYEDIESAPANQTEKTAWTFSKKATIELFHIWGTETDPDFKGYHDGNTEPLGFGHIGITVDDSFKACERFKSLGVEFVRTPDSGYFNGIALIKDPNGYWIEIFDVKSILDVTVGAT